MDFTGYRATRRTTPTDCMPVIDSFFGAIALLSNRVPSDVAVNDVATRFRWWPFAAVVASLAIVFAGVADAYARRYAMPLRSIAGLYSCFVLQLALAVAPGMGNARSANRWIRWLLPILWCFPYLLYAAGTGDWRWSAIARLLSLAVPIVALYVLVPVRNPARFAWQDALAAAALVTAVLSHQLRGVWNVPVNLDFLMRLYLLTVGAWCWTVVRPVPGLGYRFFISWKALRASTLNFCYFALIAIPAGLLLGFTAWHPRWRGAGVFCLDYLEIFLFIALLEETFFRGFLQTLAANSLGSWWKGQAVAACLFGLFHILHAPFPNWRYVLLATVAGWFYGSAFRNGGGVMASSLMHALVDALWRAFLTR